MAEPTKPKILAFAGSAREDSFNKRLARAAAAYAAEAGAAATVIDLRDFPLPLYDGDLEASEGLPENAERLYELFKAHEALLIASPEYNSSISPLLKNTIDWVSRPREGEAPLTAYAQKAAGLLAASPGQLGGLRGLVHLRSILGNIGVLVIPQQVAIGAAHEAFAPDGSLSDEKQAKRVSAMVESLVSVTRRLHAYDAG